MAKFRELLDVDAREVKPGSRIVPIDMECPYCGQYGTFAGRGDFKDASIKTGTMTDILVGYRLCPNKRCARMVVAAREHIASVEESTLAIAPMAVYRADLGEPPEVIVASFAEAVRCFDAGAYYATAAMVRRTAEIYADDLIDFYDLREKAQRLLLGKRLELLREHVGATARVISRIDLVDVFKELGNDGVHIEVRDFDITERTARDALDALADLIRQQYDDGELVARMNKHRRERTEHGDS